MLEIVSNLPKDENDLLTFGLDELAKLGAKRILSPALQLEVEEYVNSFKDLCDDSGKRPVVRNGAARPRKITLGRGRLEAQRRE